MNLIRWEPFAEPISLKQAMDRLFEDSFIRPSRFSPILSEVLAPAIDMYQTPNEVIVKANLPGVKAEELDIDITNDTLTIKGERKVEEKVKREDYFYQEQRYGVFTRTIGLPANLKTDKAEATLEDGILTLTIPKAEEAKRKAIKVKAKGTAEAKKVEAEKSKN